MEREVKGGRGREVEVVKEMSKGKRISGRKGDEMRRGKGRTY